MQAAIHLFVKPLQLPYHQLQQEVLVRMATIGLALQDLIQVFKIQQEPEHWPLMPVYIH